MVCRLSVAGLVLLVASPVLAASIDADWVWYPEGNPAEAAPAGKVWFRLEHPATQPSTGTVRVLCDDHFVLWVNGQRIGEGDGTKSHRFNLSGIVDRGVNVIAIEATNAGGRAGLFLDGEIRSQGGDAEPIDTGPRWRVTRTPPTGDDWLKPRFDESAWQPARVLGKHENSPWKEVAFSDGYLDRFETAAGFELLRIAEPELVGSLVAFTFGNRGRLIASRERGPIVSVIDSDNDGVYDQATEFSDRINNCQGLCMVGDDLYAVGDGPGGTGLYRLPDKDGDDKADAVLVLVTHQGGMGEHGPHAVVLGPDGWLYHNHGNHAGLTLEPEPTSPVNVFYEGDLLRPRFEDAGGHAHGIKVPGGSVWRLSDDAKHWWRYTVGFRNEYDIGFNSAGELFTFDSDMEWDVGGPWYRPVRVNHCVPGAEFGWRSGAAKWPTFYFDSLDAAADIGRGSPTGVVFYEHHQFPKKYHGSFLVCDWSMGRILAVFLSSKGATYTGTFENLVTGNPLNVSDIDVDRDGSVVFTTGGRNTEGGIYRVRFAEAAGATPVADSIADAIALPQLEAGWARDAVRQIKNRHADRWEDELIRVARQGEPGEQVRALTLLSQFGPRPATGLLLDLARDEAAEVRRFVAFLLAGRPELSEPEHDQVAQALHRLLGDPDPVVRRRACEAFVMTGIEGPADILIELLDDPDRWQRYSARLALERVPVEKWKPKVLDDSRPRVVTHGLLALYRVGKGTFDVAIALDTEKALLTREPALSAEETLDLLRLVELTVLEAGKCEMAEQIGAILVARFPAGNAAIDAESARLLAVLDVPGAAVKLIDQAEKAPTPAEQLHHALCLRYVESGWDASIKGRLLDWYDATDEWEGGHSFAGYLANIVGATLERYTPQDRQSLLAGWRDRPYATARLLKRSEPDQIAGHEAALAGLLEELARQPIRRHGDALLESIAEFLGKSAAPGAQALLRKMFDEHADLRDELARQLAKHPEGENRPYLVRALDSANETTLQLCLKALADSEGAPGGPADYRAVILAGLRLGPERQRPVLALLRQWTGSDALAFYQGWYALSFPDAPPAELAESDIDKSKYTFDELFAYLEKDERDTSGDVDRGREIFKKTNCIKCHRFGNEGEGIGPDLTTVRRRFQKKDIIESLLFPSRVVSDQYKSVTVLTSDGLVHTGQPVPQNGSDELVLWLSSAERLEIPRGQVEEIQPSKVSVMPEGLLKDLSLEEIADLFAFLETSKYNAEPAQAAAGGAR